MGDRQDDTISTKESLYIDLYMIKSPLNTSVECGNEETSETIHIICRRNPTSQLCKRFVRTINVFLTMMMMIDQETCDRHLDGQSSFFFARCQPPRTRGSDDQDDQEDQRISLSVADGRDGLGSSEIWVARYALSVVGEERGPSRAPRWLEADV